MSKLKAPEQPLTFWVDRPVYKYLISVKKRGDIPSISETIKRIILQHACMHRWKSGATDQGKKMSIFLPRSVVKALERLAMETCLGIDDEATKLATKDEDMSIRAITPEEFASEIVEVRVIEMLAQRFGEKISDYGG